MRLGPEGRLGQHVLASDRAPLLTGRRHDAARVEFGSQGLLVIGARGGRAGGENEGGKGDGKE